MKTYENAKPGEEADMKTITVRTEGRQGSAVLTVMGIILVISLVTATLMSVGHQKIHMANKLADRVKAAAYAEAGIAKAYTCLATNFAARTDPSKFPAELFGEGRFGIGVTPVSSNMAKLCVTGYCGTVESRVSVLLKDYGEDVAASGDPAWQVWLKAIFANKACDIRGTACDIVGDVHANGALTISGNLDFAPTPLDFSSSTDIRVSGRALSTGALTAPTITITGGNEGGIAENKVPVALIPMPTIDLTAMYNTAVANGQVKAAATYMGDVSWVGVPGGVVWINGDVRFKKNLTYDCKIVATGSIQVDGNCTFSNPTGKGELISRDSTIDIKGNASVRGLLYAPKGNITLAGNVTYVGQIIGGADVKIAGSVDALAYERSDRAAGDYNPGVNADLIAIVAWLE